jgi:hypothetical protein
VGEPKWVQYRYLSIWSLWPWLGLEWENNINRHVGVVGVGNRSRFSTGTYQFWCLSPWLGSKRKNQTVFGFYLVNSGFQPIFKKACGGGTYHFSGSMCWIILPLFIWNNLFRFQWCGGGWERGPGAPSAEEVRATEGPPGSEHRLCDELGQLQATHPPEQGNEVGLVWCFQGSMCF